MGGREGKQMLRRTHAGLKLESKNKLAKMDRFEPKHG